MVLEASHIVLAFTAGILGFLSPCALPLMPSYMAYFMSRSEGASTGFKLIRALTYSVAAIGGFISVFVVLGLIPSMAIQLLPVSSTFLNPVIGLSLITLGVISISDRLHFKPLTAGLNVFSASSGFSLFIFGLAYALASLSCSLPVFLLVVFQSASAEGLLEILALHAAYGLGAGALMVPVTVAASFSKEYMNRKLMAILPHVRTLSAVLLIASGTYMIMTSFING